MTFFTPSLTLTESLCLHQTRSLETQRNYCRYRNTEQALAQGTSMICMHWILFSMGSTWLTTRRLMFFKMTYSQQRLQMSGEEMGCKFFRFCKCCKFWLARGWTLFATEQFILFKVSIHSLAIFNGVNTISRTALNILQGLPLGGDGIEERWRDGRGGSPDENSAVVR